MAREYARVFVCCMPKLWADEPVHAYWVWECMFVLWSLKSFRRTRDWIAIKSELYAVFYSALPTFSRRVFGCLEFLCVRELICAHIDGIARFSCTAITEQQYAAQAFPILSFGSAIAYSLAELLLLLLDCHISSAFLSRPYIALFEYDTLRARIHLVFVYVMHLHHLYTNRIDCVRTARHRVVTQKRSTYVFLYASLDMHI